LKEEEDNEEKELCSSHMKNVDPELARLSHFENCLKRRIFYADRIEKVERALVGLNMIHKDIIFCSDYEFNLFKDHLVKKEVIKVISDKIQEDKEDIWFDLYKSITGQRELAERLVER
jgi:hypothetical protein